MGFSSSYHPQIDGQIKVVSKSLGNLLQCLIGDKPKPWHLLLSQVDFSYHNLVNRSIGKIPFNVVYGFSPRGVDELKDSANLVKTSVMAEDFVDYIKDLHKEVKEKLEKSTTKYKESVDIHKRGQEFQIRELV